MSSRIMRPITPNARLWVWVNDGWVKLTLRPAQSLTHRTYSRDDEGHSYGMDRWKHLGEGVLNSWQSGGSDCDGPISRAGERSCELGEVQAIMRAELRAEDYLNGRAILAPNWREVGTVEICDVYAEAAGY